MEKPRFVCLDSSTWGLLAKEITHDSSAARVLSLLNEGTVVPFFTDHHVLEIAQHENDDKFKRRIALLRSLRFLAFHRLNEEQANVGSMLDLRELEIVEILKNPDISFEALIPKVREKLINGFVSGEEFCAMNEEWWALYRRDFAPYMRAHSAEIASVTHLQMANLNEKIPAPGTLKLRPKSEVLKILKSAARSVAENLRNVGDEILRDPTKRLKSPEEVSKDFHAEVYEENLSLYDIPGDPFDNMLAKVGVSRSRLPRNATIADVGYEAIFVKTMGKHEQRLTDLCITD